MNNKGARKRVQRPLPDFPVRAAHDGEPTALERAEGERRLKLVIEILAGADLIRLQELMEKMDKERGAHHEQTTD